MTLLSRESARPMWTVLSSREEFGRPELPLLSMSAAFGIQARRLGDGRAASEDLSGYRVVRPGDLVVNRLSARDGAFGRSRFEGIISPAYWALRASAAIDSRFADYLLHSSPYVAEIRRLSKFMPPAQFDLQWDQFKWMPFPTLSLYRQRRIADFLDDQVARIDRLVDLRSGQQSLIEERAQTAIVKLLDSPRSTLLRRILREVRVGIVVQPAALYVDEGEPGVAAIRGIDVRPGVIDFRNLIKISSKGHLANPRSRLMLGDVVIVRTGVAGSAAVVSLRAVGLNCIDLVIARPGPELAAEYLEVVLNSLVQGSRIKAASSGSIQPHFGVGALLSLEIPTRPLIEQRVLATEAATIRKASGTAAGHLVRSVQLLAERKRALITAAVTGEFDVSTAGPRAAAAVTG